MRSCSAKSLMLLTSSLVAIASCTGVALAQSDQTGGPPDALAEIVVTATRQTETVNRVPLSITAETQRSLDERGIKTAADIQNTVPSLQIGAALGGNASTGAQAVTIRGIQQSSAGAATTGIYLDDTALQKRNAGGGVQNANGSPLPPLFDLERVEVLRGPQGTLFGGGSEGGTVRFIMPSPSLTRYSVLARAEASTTHEGDNSYEVGLAGGGPIIADKLGFRLSVFRRDTGGFIDNYNPYNGQLIAKDTNNNEVRVFRGALTWAPTDRSKITFSYYSSVDKSDNATNSFNLSTDYPIVVPVTCYNTSNITNLPLGPQRSAPAPVARGAACATAPGVTHVQPGGSFGPYKLDDYASLTPRLQPSTTNLQLATLTFDYDLGGLTVKAITSYIDDQNKTLAYSEAFWNRTMYNATYGPITVPQGIGLLSGFPTIFQNNGMWPARNERYGLTQEVRFASAGDARPFSWVSGVYYSNLRQRQDYDYIFEQWDQLYGYLYGLNSVQAFGVPPFNPLTGLNNSAGGKHQNMKDVEIAAFGEGNYWVTDKLRLTAGIRVSRVTFDYSQVFFGPFAGISTPTIANGGANSGSVSESPVTPKFSAQYFLTSDDMVYVTAAKGFRAGGINSYITRAVCGLALQQYGLNPEDLPLEYKSDSVWNYEAGGKFRLFGNRLQLNGAVYKVDWKDPQVTITPGFNCGLANTYNAKAAVSKGIELEAQVRLFRGLTANGGFGYNKTYYTDRSIGVTGPTGVQLITSLKGQRFALPPYTINVGVQYEFSIGSLNSYVRGDWRFQKGYEALPFGVAGWNPDANVFPSQQRTNVRAGVRFNDFDINVFATNLFNLEKGNITGGRAGCTLPQSGGTEACNVFAVYNPLRTTNWGRPREIGIQINYRR